MDLQGLLVLAQQPGIANQTYAATLNNAIDDMNTTAARDQLAQILRGALARLNDLKSAETARTSEDFSWRELSLWAFLAICIVGFIFAVAMQDARERVSGETSCLKKKIRDLEEGLKLNEEEASKKASSSPTVEVTETLEQTLDEPDDTLSRAIQQSAEDAKQRAMLEMDARLAAVEALAHSLSCPTCRSGNSERCPALVW